MIPRNRKSTSCDSKLHTFAMRQALIGIRLGHYFQQCRREVLPITERPCAKSQIRLTRRSQLQLIEIISDPAEFNSKTILHLYNQEIFLVTVITQLAKILTHKIWHFAHTMGPRVDLAKEHENSVEESGISVYGE